MSTLKPKRPRNSTSSKSEGDSEPKSGPASPKAKRTSISTSSIVSCSLPPTCNPPRQPTILVNAKEFEQHYATCHTHICTAPEVRRHPGSSRESQCGKIFPDARFLDLHLSEYHDPLAAVRQERGERTLVCFVESCSGRFSTPKGRRLHLIDVHHYPKEYYFAVTTKGIGDLLNRCGQGASLLRKEWKPRGPAPKTSDAMDVESPSSDDASSPKPSSSNRMSSAMVSPPTSPNIKRSSSPPSPSVRTNGKPSATDDVDNLTSGLSSLSLVPQSIRFGRGGRAGGMLGRGHKAASTRSQGEKESDLQKSPTKILGGGKRPSRGRAVGHGYDVVGKAQSPSAPTSS